MCSMVAGVSSFHLEWNNHLGNMQTVLETLYTQQSLVDVTIACHDGVLKAHKVILSACSPYFEAVFRETPCKHPVLILKGVNVREMQALLRFMYRGQVDVPEAELSALVATACEFKVKGFSVDGMPGVDEYRNDSASEHESESESSLGNLMRVSLNGRKKSDEDETQDETSVKHSERLSSVNEEVAVTPVIVESQSLQETPVTDEKKERKEKKEKDNGDDEDEDKKPNAEELAASLTVSEPPAAENSATTSGATSSSSSSASSSTSSAVSTSVKPSNDGSGEATPYRRETRYKGQKRVDVGIRPAAGRARSVDKRESSSIGVETRNSAGLQVTKKARVSASAARKAELSLEADRPLVSPNQAERNIIIESSAIAISVSNAAGSVESETGPQQYVKIKAEAESADEDDEEEATADMFCIPHLQELPDIDGADPSGIGEEMDVATRWTLNPPNPSLSGREQRTVSEAPAEEGEGDMACPYCFTRCPRFSDLKRHMRLHTEDKPHECEFCSLAFARASHLARHRRTHTGERPFRCPAPSCDRSFSRQDKLKLHTQRAHPGLPCDLVQSGSFMRIRGRRRIRDKNLPLGLRLGIAPSRPATNSTSSSVASSTQSAISTGPAVISLPFGDTSYLTSLSLGQQRYSDLTISPVTTSNNAVSGGSGSSGGGGGAEELLKSVRQLGECTIQTLPSKVMAE